MTCDDAPVACVLGDADLVRPLGLAGVRCAVVAGPDHPATHSRFVDHVVTVDRREPDDRLLDRLIDFAAGLRRPPVLFYQRDADALFVSRHRDRLRESFRLTIAAPGRVEELLDKVRFAELARSLELPVPVTVVLDPGLPIPGDLPYPVIVKPPSRGDGRWAGTGERAKALRVDDADDLRALRDRMAGFGSLVVQELVDGPENRIESYHAYVDADGAVVGEFTGRKIRTRPADYGFTTSCVVTDAFDVLELGRHVMRALDLTGVAKVDLKRAENGGLRLLEVNPRFNLWHHAGAVAGVNLPALVWADLTGRPRPPVARARSGVRWCSAHDRHPARAAGMSGAAWLAWALRSEAKSNFAWDDPALVYRRAWRSARGR